MSRIRWRKPLTITAERKEIQVRIRKDDRHLNWEVCSENGRETIVHADGELHPAENDGPEERISIDEIKARCPHEADGNSLYHQFRQNGLNYGFYYQGIHQAWMNTDEALSLIRLPDVFEPELKTFTFHPAILDAALQIIAGLRGMVQSQTHRPYVPFSLEQIEIYQPLPATCYAYVKAAGPRRYHVAVTDEIGRVCVKFHDIALRELPDPLEAFFYLPRWTPKPLSLPPGNATDVPERPTQTLAVSDERKTLIVYRPDSADLLKALESLHPKGRVLKIKLGKRNRRYSERHWEVNPSDAKGLNRWVEKCEAIQSVWFLGGIRYEPADPDSLEALEEEQEIGVLSFFRLIQSMIRNGLLHPLPEITVLTDTVHPVRSTDRIRPWSSSLCGLSKVLAREYPDLPIRCIDICMEELPAQPTRRQVQEFLSPVIAEPFQTDALSEISIRDGNRFVRIIEPIQLPPVYPPPFKKRGVYLFLGGAGGIGRVMSRYLAQTVEARVAWIGRSALDAEQQGVISRIETLGGEVFHAQADAGDMESMREAVSKIKKRFGRIDGVFHSAIVLKDKALYNMDEESFREALDPKVRGSLILYTVLKNEPLDFLAFFSSSESLIVNAGQGNYAAACTFKDSFAHHLSRRLKFPVKIINWGYWGRVGVVAADEYNRRMTSAGYGCVEPDDGTDALCRVLAHPVTQIMPLKAEFHLLESAGIDGTHCLTLYPQNLPSLIHAAVSRVQSPPLEKKKRRHWKRAWHEMNRFGRHLLLNVFQQMGIFHHGGQHLEKEILRNRLGIIPEYNRLFEALLNILAQAGWIRNGKTALHTLEALDSPEINQEIERLGEEYLRLVSQYPDMTAHFRLLKVCIDAYPEVLTGARRHMEVMFPGGSKSLVEGIYREEPVTVYANRLLAVLLRQYLRERQAATPGTPLQIIEVGAGTGGTSRFVLEAIKDHPGPLRYFYTDISRGFTEYGRQTLGDEYAFVEFITFNIEAPLQDQGLNPDSADLVFGTNVVHATRSVENTVNQLKRLLKANGLLILNEITQAQDFHTLTFGLTDGWWRYEEPNLRVPYSPLLTVDKWQQVLKTSGFRNVHLMGLPEESPEDWKQGIIVGESDGLIRVETEPFLLEDEPSEESEEDAEPFVTTIPVAVSSTALDRFHPAESDPAENLLKEKTRDYLKTVLSEVLKSNKSRIDSRTTFERYGVDSLVTLEITKRLEKDFGRLPATLLFENMTVEKLSDFLFDFHGSRLEEIFKTPAGPVHTDAGFHSEEPKTVTSESLPPYPEASASEKRIRMISGERRNRQSERWSDQDIAVIGLYGRYPLAEDLRTFWVQLKNGKSGIRQIPETRWDWRRYFESEGSEKKAGIYSKWGGFIEDADKFDPHFFKISPREARSMDPQERIFLEAAWAVIEDAGYTIQRLLRDGRDIGTFVGVMNGNYEWLSGEAYAKGSLPEAQSAYWSIANRISYLFDFQGPSLAVDTACSSSLTAVHLACECIRKGDCRMAVAGGVNLILHPMHFQRLCRLGMLSRDAKSKSFGVGADGFVDGEGVGAVLLRPLDDALAHGDQIYGIIKGSGINAGGKTGGFTVPNPNAQSDLIVSAIRKAGIDPETVTCIEAHGTGTELGDPIEVAGLTRAFRTYTSRTGYCSLGSVKSNIGHLESAAGIAGLTKVLLQMKNRQLVPSLNSEKINPHLQLDESPFYVQQHLADWPQPVVMDENRAETRLPRRAGVSSFGAGGANAHVIVEEYQEEAFSVQGSGERGEGIGLKAQSSKVKVESATVRCEGSGVRGEPQLIVLSAKNEDRLRAYAAKMVEFFSTIENRKSKIENIAYTLQVGREAMEDRLATVVSDPAELREKLNRFVRGVSPREGVCSGTARIGDPSLMLEDEEEGREYLRNLFQKKRLEKLGQLWVSGVPIDWSRLHEDGKYRRVSLPTYPFARERYWIPEADGKRDGMGGFREKLHPLVERNTSTLSEQMFSTRLSGREFYLSEHVILDQKVLPGVAYLELARAAGELSDRRPVRALKNVVWMKPIVVSEHPVDVHIGLHPKEENVEFMVFTADENDRRQRHAQGILIFEDPAEQPPVEAVIDIDAIRKRCPKKLTKSEFYAPFKGVGFDLGESFKVVEEIRGSDIDALAVIHLPPNRKTGYHDFALHPSVMDGALQSTIGLIFETFQSPGLPFSLGRLEVLSPMTGHRYFAHALAAETAAPDSEVKRYDILIADESGQVVVSIKDFVGRPLQQKGSGGVYFRPVWLPADISLPEAAPTGPVLLFDLDESRRKAFERQLKTRVIQVYPGERYEVRSDGTYSLRPGRFEDYRKLLASLNQMDCMPRHVLHAWSQAPFSADVSRLDAQLEKGFYSIFHLSRALLELKPLETIQILFFYLEGTDPPQPQYAALSGFGRSIQLETSRLNFKTIALADIKDSPNAASVELSPTDGPEVCYRQGRRWIRRLQAFTPDEPVSASMLREGGVYIITGGGGGLGRIIAGHLLSRVKAHVILTGRSPLDPERSAEIEALGTLGGEIVYIQSDVTRRDHVDTLISTVKGRFGKINGIIHGAGIIRDALLINKKLKAAKAVLGPKVTGTVHLDEATRSESLDFFILFSSIAALTGNIGQCDYAFANSFMDHFAQLREARRIDGTRSGKTVAVNWPLWQGGGMRVDGETEKWMSRTLGTDPLKPDAGLAALFTGLGAADSQFAFVQGDPEKIRKVLMPDTDPHPADETSEEPTQEGSGSLIKKVQTELLPMAAAVVKVDPGIIKAEENFSRYGFESLTFTEFSNRINQKYRLEITPTLFFEYPSLYRFSRFLSETYPQALLKYHGEKDRTPFPASANRALQVEREETEGVGSRNRFDHKRASGGRRQAVSETEPSAQAPVAIIGMSGRMPQSKNPEQFWEHLWEGKDLIREVPQDRWDWRAIYGDPIREPGKTWAKWGGFMPAVDRFDCRFFNIPPREAALMDPQHRLFLQTVWETVEDAGYRASDFAGTRTGLYVGVATNDYYELMLRAGIPLPSYMAAFHSMLANQISYLMDMRGPSEPIDTTCSSSLVAIHHAMASIQSGQCEMALAGGVNAILSPTVTTACSKAGMLAVDGRCKTFDERADGYVRGEGVGAVLLKPLDQAEADGDHIYAVVLGTAENHGGHAASLTAPNPAAQAELLVQVYEKAGVSPDTVGYIESHGTGTSLGDPIEINGLKDAFARLYAARGESVPQHPHCGLGSVKTNIGHLETAAGIIGVIKVLLALKHHRLPASLHLEKLNPYIQLEGSPFYIVDKRMAWEPLKDRQGNRIPRRAGVSSFGIGGVNAHAVLEEYEEKEFSVQSSEFRGEPQLIVLSAKNEDRLREYAKRMADFIEIQNLSVADIAYTLQVGREPMTERLAAVVSTVEEMRDRLVRFSSGESDIPDFFRGSARGVGRGAETLAEEEEGRAMIAGMMRKGKIKKLARLWVSGWTIDFRQLHLTGGRKRRLSLPPYPFAEERHWFSEKKGVSAVPTETGRPLADSAPLETHLEHRFSGSFFIPGWEPVSTELSESPSTDPKTEPGNVLILHNPEDEKMASEIFRTYSQERVYFIRLGKKTRRISDRLWETDCNDEAALKGCLANIPALDRIFHLGGIEHRAFDPKDRPALEESRKRGTLTLFRLVKCLDASGADRRPIQIRIVTHSVHPAASADTVRPGSAGLYGLARTVANEYPKFGIQGIDIDFIDVDDPEEKERIRRFLQHLAASRMDHLGDEIACRGERLYTRLLQPIRLAQKNGIRLRQKGIYLIAGGAGRIGFELSLRLARDAAARTVWIGRREPDAEIRNRMERIEGAGGKVLYLQADVTSAADMKKAVEAATSRFGNIQGAFHCATQAGIQMLRDMDEQTFLSAMRPKSEGSIALFRSLESEPLDFIMFFSSSQSFIGDRGLGHYAAACAFQDGLAHYLRQTATIPVVSVNWGLWKTEIGDASVHGKAVIDALGFDPIEPDEAMAAAWRILDHGISQVMFLKAEDRLYRRIGIKDPTPKRRYPERMPQTLLKLSDRLQTPPLSAHRIKAHRKAFGELEAIGRHRLLNAFNQMGILKKEGDAHAVADLRSGLGITPSHDQLFIELLNILKRAAFVEISGETIVASAKIADPKGLRDPDAMEKQQADLVSRFPEISAYAKLLDACIRRYPEILTGQLPATDVLFPDGSLDPVDHVYRDNETADHFNRQTARIVQAYLEGRETLPERDEKIRILEVGAGTGGTSRSVLSAVHSFGHRLEYMYTDVSRRFIRHGKDRFRQYPFLQFGLLNISEDPLSQGYQPDRYDMVIAANVIHATADLRNTLGHIKSLLKTNGWLVFNEVTAPLEFGTMTFGLLEGWWMFKDHACRMPGTPLLSVSLWQKLIEAEGFRHTAYFGLSGRHDDESDQHILVAESDGIVGESLGEEIGSTLGSPDRDSVMLAAKPPAAVFSARDRSATIQERIKECLAAVLELDLEEFEAETPFSEFGVDSILALEIINQINDALSIRLRSTDLFNYATIAHLTDHIVNAFTADPASLASAPATTRADRLSAKNPVPVVAPGDTRAPGSLDIAVIGMAGRFPDAEDVHGFWKNLSLGRDSISTFPESRSLNRPSGDAESDQGRSPYRWGGFLADIDCFDPGFFNMPPKEAELTDPQQRLFLQEAWHALEDAGYSPGLLKGRKCGVFAGYNVIEYQNTLLQFDAPLDAHSFTGNMASVLAARISYFLDLKGPSIAVNTACSSSLVAVHLACESIRYGTSDMALAGGVMVMTSGHFHEFGNRLGMLSPDGQCKTFDSRADGFVPGEGVGVVVLKPLDAAIRDGDHIYGTIIGSGINQDGKTSGITAPSAVSQAALEKEVYRTYGIQPETISYVEAHGTGTELGDPIEVQALTEAFREFTDNRRFCALGSVKTNIGHTTAAAGVAGLIKVLLCLKHGKLVPSLHFVSENRHFSLRNGPFYVNTELVDWNTEQGMPKRAAVSAFGLSGTNAHLVVEEYQEKGFRVQGSGFRVEPQLIVLSAKNEERLKEYAERIIKFLDSTLNSERLTLNLLDIAYTLQIGRAEWEERLALVVSDAEELKEMLKAFVNGTEHRAFFRGNKRKDRLRLDEVLKGRSASKAMGTAIEAGDIRQIAELWTLGTTVDWMRIHSSEVKPKRVSLPGYPFSKERYWVSMPTPSRDSDAKEAFQGGNGIDAGVFEELQSLAQGRSSAEDVHQLIRKRLQTT